MLTAVSAIILGGILTTAEVLSKLPFAEASFRINWQVMLGMYALIIFVTYVLQAKRRSGYSYDVLA